MKHLLLQIRRFIYSLFMKHGKDEPTHLKETEVKWTCGHQWGNYHPDYPFQWWHQGAADALIYGNVIEYRHHPKSIQIEGESVNMNYRKAVRRSVTLFTRGFFHFEVYRIPTEGSKDAIWLTGDKYWPPEIDIVEMYNNKHESNFHIRVSGEPFHLKAQRHAPAKTYSCWWEKDFIKIYYDGFLVREYTDMKYFREAMALIINTSCTAKKQIPHEMTVIPKVYL